MKSSRRDFIKANAVATAAAAAGIIPTSVANSATRFGSVLIAPLESKLYERFRLLAGEGRQELSGGDQPHFGLSPSNSTSPRC